MGDESLVILHIIYFHDIAVVEELSFFVLILSHFFAVVIPPFENLEDLDVFGTVLYFNRNSKGPSLSKLLDN